VRVVYDVSVVVVFSVKVETVVYSVLYVEVTVSVVGL